MIRKSWLLGAVFCFSLAAEPVSAADAPIIVSAQANAPGWITINYTHSGDGGVIGFYIERKGAGVVYSSPAPVGQVTDANLKPDTEYSYRACAVYDDEDEARCSPFLSERTQPAQGKPGSYDPPLVKDVGLDFDRITVFWGPVGAYSIILLRLDDAGGNLGQWDTTSVANGSFTFKPLQPDTTYHVILKGCSYNVFAGHSCGPWSPRFTFTTFGPQPPPPPPGKPTLTIAETTASTISLAWEVKIIGNYPGDRAMLHRDGKPYRELEPRSAIDGLKGAYTDTVKERHSYEVCYEREVISVEVCSDPVRDPLMRSSSEAEISASVVKKFEKDEAIEPKLSVAGPSFAGVWDTVTGGGGSYRMTLEQHGGAVIGTYDPNGGKITSTSIARAPDGGSVITFVWTEATGSSGAGRFALSADGQSFSGGWSSSSDPNAVSGAWTGARAGSGNPLPVSDPTVGKNELKVQKRIPG